MKKAFLFLILVQISVIQSAQIIADHTIVDLYDDIPSNWIDSVKKMHIYIPGTSHALAYSEGLKLLEALDSRYQVNVSYEEPYTSNHLRFSNTWVRPSPGYGIEEEHWFTWKAWPAGTEPGEKDTIPNILDRAHTKNAEIDVIGFGWCVDFMSSYSTAARDPIYKVKWRGPSVGGPDGSRAWGLDAADYSITNNRVSLTTYLEATEWYQDYCDDRGYDTKVIFTTGVADSVIYYGEPSYQRYIKNEYLRSYVKSDPSRVLLDYEDIVCYDDGSTVPHTAVWSYEGVDYKYPLITPGNSIPFEGYHISQAGALRLGKAIWWMMARIAGWDGMTGSNHLTGITVTGAGGAAVINSDKGQLQLIATVLPADATNKTVTWSMINGTGQATINSTGLVTAVSNGTVTARATATDGSGVVGSLVITISNQQIPVTGITVTGTGGATSIASDNGALQLTATVAPSNATNKTVTWSVVNGTGQAKISSSGLVTAVASGTVTARATATDGSGVVGSLVVTISGQVIAVTGITVTGTGGATTIASDNGTLQLTATVAPANATNKTVTWSIVNGTGQATINSTGLVRAVAGGTVTARATATDGSGIVGSLVITISGQVIPVTSITVTGTGGSSVISSDNGTLQLTASVSPADATNKTVTWSVVNGTGQATINSTGLVTALANGTVTARATANDGSGIVGSLVITISSQVIPVTGITVTGTGGATTITSDNGTLQLTATVTPTDATNKTVTWSIVNGTGQATINTTGLVTAVANGTVTARATTNDGSGVVGSLVITISGQVIPVTGITVTGASGATTITSDNGTLQLTATVTPTDATNKTVTWSIVNGTGQATINSTGLVTAVSNGTVTARATANDGSGIVGSIVITISGQVIPVTGITVTGASGATTITSDNGTLQLTANVTPADATNKTVTWSILNGTGQATINSTGLVTAVSNGTVTARATANDGSGIVGSLVITISSQVIPVTGITVTGTGGSSVISSDNGTLQLTATVLPADATNRTVTWSIVNGTGQATISSTGLVMALANGTVTARATATDGSGVVGSLVITIGGQIIPVTSITVTGSDGATAITSDNGTLQLTATVTPSDATNKTVAWSIVNGTGQATINTTGLVTAVSNGTVTARATANDGSGTVGSLVITISSQTIPVTGITVIGSGGVTTIDTDDGTLQMVATVIPGNATIQNVTWSLVKGVGHASISESGLVTARSNGTVTVRATSTDGSNVFGEAEITLVQQILKITAIKIKVINKSASATTVDGELTLSAEIEPADATDQSVTWSVINGTGMATINEKGLLAGVAPGDVTVVATANDGSGVEGELSVWIDLVESIRIRYTRNEIILQVPDRLLPAKVSLHNLHGSHIQTKVLDTTECVIDISSMMPGIYVVSVYNSVVHDAAKIAISY